jgi:hypothetical protein
MDAFAYPSITIMKTIIKFFEPVAITCACLILAELVHSLLMRYFVIQHFTY